MPWCIDVPSQRVQSERDIVDAKVGEGSRVSCPWCPWLWIRDVNDRVCMGDDSVVLHAQFIGVGCTVMDDELSVLELEADHCLVGQTHGLASRCVIKGEEVMGCEIKAASTMMELKCAQ